MADAILVLNAGSSSLKFSVVVVSLTKKLPIWLLAEFLWKVEP